ncbi:MAG: helix-turn-helix transcriptional regulator [Duncaniella sp.]|nr:helix-turn-helix transcriptional regulator [Duncaniella sp.]
MKIISADTPLSEVVLADPSIIPVINRLGITLGTEDRSVADVAVTHRLSPDFLVTIINTFASRDYFPATALSRVDMPTMLGYLELTDRYYRHFQIPNIERHFNALVASGPDNSSLTLLRRLFEKAKADLITLIDNDVRSLFPALRTLASGHSGEGEVPTVDTSAAESVEEMLADLLSMIVRNISGEYDPNLCYATIVAVAGLRTDLSKNNRIRNLILRPAALELASKR